MALEGYVLAVLLGEEGADLDALVGPQNVELVHRRRLEVRPGHMVLVLVVYVQNALVRHEEVLAFVKWVQVALNLALRVNLFDFVD